MASSSLLLLSAAVLLAGAASASAPPYCVPGQRIPLHPLPSCRWYVPSRTCGTELAPYLPVEMLKERCCGELEAVAPECRCKALRVMMDEMSPRPDMPVEQQQCWHAQAVFAATVVTGPECGLRTIHGAQVCSALSAEN